MTMQTQLSDFKYFPALKNISLKEKAQCVRVDIYETFRANELASFVAPLDRVKYNERPVDLSDSRDWALSTREDGGDSACYYYTTNNKIRSNELNISNASSDPTAAGAGDANKSKTTTLLSPWVNHTSESESHLWRASRGFNKGAGDPAQRAVEWFSCTKSSTSSHFHPAGRPLISLVGCQRGGPLKKGEEESIRPLPFLDLKCWHGKKNLQPIR